MVLSCALPVFAGQGPSCEERLHHARALADLSRASRDQAESTAAEWFSRYQDATKQLEELRAQPPKEGK
jgi:hypothetical protein